MSPSLETLLYGLRTTYYIKLPQSVAQVTNANGVQRNLETFHGADNLAALSKEDFKTTIIDLIDHQCAITLNPAAWNTSNATIDAMSIATKNADPKFNYLL